MQTQDKFLAVESIRGVACFMVLLSHISLTFFPFLHSFWGTADPANHEIQSFIHNLPFGFFYSGTSAVFIFFVLSGFILTKVALREGNTSINILSMGIKRYPRLMIPALASCLLAYAFFIAFDITSIHLTDWINEYGSHDYSLTGAIRSGMLDVFFLSGFSSYNPVLWTMKIELLGSFVIYLLCLNRVTPKIPFFVELILILVTIIAASKFVNLDLGLGIISFYVGYLFSIYGKKISHSKTIILAVLGLYLAGAHNTSSSYSFIYSFLNDYTYKLCNFASGFFIVYVIIYNEKLKLLFSGKATVFMGKVSFSVYLIHMAILSTFGVFLFDTLFYYSESRNFSAILASLSTIALVYVCSIFFYRAVDLQGVIISNKFAKYVISSMQTFKKAVQQTRH